MTGTFRAVQDFVREMEKGTQFSRSKLSVDGWGAASSSRCLSGEGSPDLAQEVWTKPRKVVKTNLGRVPHYGRLFAHTRECARMG